jgi:hypothetical protein
VSEHRYYENQNRRTVWLLVIAFIGAIATLWAMGTIVLLFNPPSEIDKKCLGKPLAEVGRCMYDTKREAK